MVAALLTPADILARPQASARRVPALTRDFTPPPTGKRFLQATGAEIVEKGIDPATMSFPAIISTPDVDRVGDILVPQGCDLSQYKDNPIVFLNHASESIPIGVSEGSDGRLYVAIVPDKQVLARCFMVQGGKFGNDAEDIFHLIVQRAFNCVSVGFQPHPDRRFKQPLDTGGFRYEKWILLEWSLVGVPANPAAQVIRKYLTDGKITGKTISSRLVKCLSPLAEPTPVQVTSGFAAPTPAPAQSQTLREPLSKRWANYKSKRNNRMSQAAPDYEAKRDFTQAQRDRAADSGAALSDGSFPIHNAEDLKNALQAVGRAKDQEKVRRHISSRARALNLQHLLPDDWNDRPGGSGAKPKKDDKKAMSDTAADAVAIIEKALSVSSGAAGGYAAANGADAAADDAAPAQPNHAKIKDDMAEVMASFDTDSAAHGGMHQAHYKAETGEAYHVHGDAATDDYKQGVAKGLAGIEGIKSVTQSAEQAPPDDSGYEQVYPPHPAAQGKAAEEIETKAVETPESLEAKRKAQLAYHIGRGKAYQDTYKSILTAKDAVALDVDVQKKLPEIAAEYPELSDEQRRHIAFSLCVEKAVADYQKKDAATGDASGGSASQTTIPEEDSSTVQPPSLKLCQQVSEIIEAALPGLEPETSDFWEDILDFIQDHGAERYPDAFPADDDDDDDDSSDAADGGTAKSDSDFADQVSANYAKKPSKAMRFLLQKSMQALRKGDHLPVIKAAADFCHDMADKALGYTFGKTEKGLMKEHARNLDRVHGAATAYARPGAADASGNDGDNDADDSNSSGGQVQPVAKGLSLEHPDTDSLFVQTVAAAIEKSLTTTVNGATAAATSVTTEDPAIERWGKLGESLTNIFGTRF